jgi:hypothetical protein
MRASSGMGSNLGSPTASGTLAKVQSGAEEAEKRRSRTLQVNGGRRGSGMPEERRWCMPYHGSN